MSLLDGGLTAIFGAAFSGVYVDGTLTRTIRTELPGGSFTRAPTGQPVKVQREALTLAMRQEAGYTDKDVRLLVLADGVTQPSTDDRITAYGAEYAIGSVSNDPAQTYWDLRVTPA